VTLAAASVLVTMLSPVAARARVIERVSLASDGAQADDDSSSAALSGDGRVVAFHSFATNLVPGDTNFSADVFAHDRLTGTTSRVSVASDGAQANDRSLFPAISADGRFVAFHSDATNLVPGDTNGVEDVFVHDRLTGETTRVSVASGGAQANGRSIFSTISADGRFVAFHSDATNLVPGDTNGVADVFVHDRLTGTTSRVSVASDGAEANATNLLDFPSVSADGRFVAFLSAATNLVPGDTNGVVDVFVHDRLTGTASRVSVASDGSQANNLCFGGVSISADGRFVAFGSFASNLVPGETNVGRNDIFVHDRLTGATSRASVTSDGAQAHGDNSNPKISADGRFVAFDSAADDLVPGDTTGTDAFVHDRVTAATTRVSLAFNGAQPYSGVGGVEISADGRFVAFASSARNLVPDDTNRVADVFVVGLSRRLSLVIRGTDDGIHHNRFDGATWSGFAALPGATADIPALAASGAGVLDLVVRGTDDGVYHNHFDGATWSGWTALPGATADIPALAASGGGVLDLVVRGTDDGVYHNHSDGATWSGWTALPGATADIPALAASGGGVLDLVVRGTDDGVYHNHFDGATWGGWTALPGATADVPALAASGGGILDLVIRGIDNGVYHNRFDGTAWEGWTALPGATADIPALAASGGGVLDLVVRGTDNSIYHNRFDGATWEGWTALPGATTDIPALVASGGGVLDLVVRGTDNGVYHNHFDGSQWSGWTAVGGSTASRPALVVE
jgi:Tol biopolymer transport system component